MITISTYIKNPTDKDRDRALKWQEFLIKDVKNHNTKTRDKYHHYLKIKQTPDFISIEYHQILITKQVRKWLNEKVGDKLKQVKI